MRTTGSYWATQMEKTSFSIWTTWKTLTSRASNLSSQKTIFY